MVKVQIIDNENMIKYADLENCEVWLLNKVTGEKLDSRIIDIIELTESSLPNNHKFPQLMTEIFNKYPNEDVYDDVDVMLMNEDGTPMLDENGQRVIEKKNMLVGSQMTFEYEVITENKSSFEVHAYICDEQCITDVSKEA